MPPITMPQLGESVTEGTIGRWLKKPGDRVERDESLVEIITDKVNAEIPSPSAGVLERISAEEGAVVAVGQEIAYLMTDGERAAPATTSNPAGASVASPESTGSTCERSPGAGPGEGSPGKTSKPTSDRSSPERGLRVTRRSRRLWRANPFPRRHPQATPAPAKRDRLPIVPARRRPAPSGSPRRRCGGRSLSGCCRARGRFRPPG